ncbi:regulatory protein [Salmonella enterica subsp. houtenae]|nr:regulatory protein [Salmonella enterica subsp. houtenae]
MNRLLAVVLALVLAALGWQSWRLNNASHTIETQGAVLKSKTQELTKKKQPADRPVHSDRNQQPGADAALCGSGTDHRTAAKPSAPDRGTET